MKHIKSHFNLSYRKYKLSKTDEDNNNDTIILI